VIFVVKEVEVAIKEVLFRGLDSLLLEVDEVDEQEEEEDWRKGGTRSFSIFTIRPLQSPKLAE